MLHCCKTSTTTALPSTTESTTEFDIADYQEVTPASRADATAEDYLDIFTNTGASLKYHRNINLINLKTCGYSIVDRIVGGTAARVKEFPWLALLQYRSTYDDEFLSFKCAGSLIAERYILTGKWFQVWAFGAKKFSFSFSCSLRGRWSGAGVVSESFLWRFPVFNHCF